MLKNLINCIKILKQYWSTPKGHHDIKDYGKALLLMIIISIIISIILAMTLK